TKNLLFTFSGHQEFSVASSQSNQKKSSPARENKKVSDTFATFQGHTLSSVKMGRNVFSLCFSECPMLPLTICGCLCPCRS
uniref:Uncharacterized protein n=1 Tax=Geospiza parvula TaxID=87175 RepID=A0A8C3MNJ3_GEOPR